MKVYYVKFNKDKSDFSTLTETELISEIIKLEKNNSLEAKRIS